MNDRPHPFSTISGSFADLRRPVSNALAKPSAPNVIRQLRAPGPLGARADVGASLIELVIRRVSGLGADEALSLRALPYRDEIVKQGRVICDGLRSQDDCGLLVSGAALCAHSQGHGDPTGVGLLVPGDFVDLPRLVMSELDYVVVAQQKCLVRRYDRRKLRDLFQKNKACLRAFWALSLAEARRHRTWIAANASLRTEARIAHFLCELHERLGAVGLVCESRFEMPLYQKSLGELLGYSRSQTNRSIKCLRNRDLISWDGNLVLIKDPERLADLARFTPGQV